MGRMIGYARLPERGSDVDGQRQELLNAGVATEDLYVDHGASAAGAQRPGLNAALATIRAGDTLTVTRLDRLGYSTQKLLSLHGELTDKDAMLRVLDLDGVEVNTGSDSGRLLSTLLAGLSHMERELRLERMGDSIARRRAAHQDTGGRKERFSDNDIRKAVQEIDAGKPASQVAAAMGMSRATLYRRRAELNVME